MTVRAIVPIIMLFVCADLAGADTTTVTRQQYIARLQYVFVQPNATAAPRIKDVVGNVGGHVDSEAPDRLVMTIPDAAISTIMQHPAIKYLQRVVSGATPMPTSTTSAHQPIATNATHALTPSSVPPWDSGTYTYDGAGNISKIGTDTYTYDGMSRLNEAHVRGTRETYTYDAFSNLTAKTTFDRTPELIVDLTPDIGNNNHLKDYGSYDTAGNLTGNAAESHVYDPFNMMVEKSVSSGVHEYYIYDANDERIGVVNDTCPTVAVAACWTQFGFDSKLTWSFRDESGRVLRQFDIWYSQLISSNPFMWLEDYVYRDGLLLAGERMSAEGGRRHFHLDHLGTPRLVTGTSGQHLSEHDYYPFGIEQTSICQEVPSGFDREEPPRFTGHLRDFNTSNTDCSNANYVDYMHARSTIPQWGRFLSVDPVVDAERALHSPQMWNRYAYVVNNPMRYNDPTGKELPAPLEMFKPQPDTPAERAIRQGALFFGLMAASEGIGIIFEVPAAVTVTRYMGEGEANTAQVTGEIPNVNQRGEPRPTHVTTDKPINNATLAQQKYDLPVKPTHRATVPVERVPGGLKPAPGGPKTSGGSQAVTNEPIPVKPTEIKPLNNHWWSRIWPF